MIHFVYDRYFCDHDRNTYAKNHIIGHDSDNSNKINPDGEEYINNHENDDNKYFNVK